MISLESISQKGKKSDFENHRWIADLLYFEGPILSLFKGAKDQDYFYCWCENSISRNRWLAIPVSRIDITDYVSRQRSLTELIYRNSLVFFIETNVDGDVDEVRSLLGINVPEAYLPPVDSYFDNLLCPTEFYTELAPSIYSISIDKEWFFDDFSTLEKIYTQVYSFVYSLRNLNLLGTNAEVQRAFKQYPWRGGFSSVNFYEKLRTSVPSIHEPRVRAIRYASPGSIELELHGAVAQEAGSLIQRFEENIDSISNEYKEIRSYLKNLGLLSITRSDVELDQVLTDHVRSEISNYSNTFSRKLGLESFSEDIVNLAGNPLVSIKILLSLYRRLHRISVYQEDGRTTF